MRALAFAIALTFTTAPVVAIDGVLDPSFVSTGVRTVVFDQGGAALAHQDNGMAVLRLADGKYLLAGSVRTVDGGFDRWRGGLARLNSDGNSDNTFSLSGEQNIGGGRVVVGSGFTGVDDLLLYSLEPLPGSDALLAGDAIGGGGIHYGWYRYYVNLAFGTGGAALGPANSYYSHAFSPPGDSNTLFLIGGRRIGMFPDMDLYFRVETASGLGYSYSYDHSLAFDLGSDNNDYGMRGAYRFIPSVCSGEICTQPRDRVYIVGHGPRSDGYGNCFVISYSRALPTGTWARDSSFTVQLNFDTAVIPSRPTQAQCRDIAVQADGKILVAGEAYVRLSGSLINNASSWVLARLNPNGSLDTSFNAGGPKPGTIGYFYQGAPTMPGIYNSASFVRLQSDRRILIGGYASTAAPAYAPSDMGFMRLLSDGSIDGSFGAGGLAIVSLDSGIGSGRREWAQQAILEPTRLTAIGSRHFSADDYDYLVTRLINDDLIFADGFGD